MRVLNDFGRPRLGVRLRLGYAQGSPEEAALSFAVSAKAFEGVSNWPIPDSDWTGAASEIARRSDVEVKNLEKNVLGKLGNPEAEEAAALLYENWKYQRSFGLDALKNPPGWWDQTRAKIQEFWSDFKEGAFEAWQEYSDAAVSMAGPLLKSYWGSVSRINVLNKDLENATASWRFSKEVLADQAAKIAAAEAKVESIRDLYRRASFGSSIDKVANQEYGPYELSAGFALPASSAIGLVAISVMVLGLAYILSPVKRLADAPGKIVDWVKDPENRSTLMVLSVVAVAAILVPYLLKD